MVWIGPFRGILSELRYTGELALIPVFQFFIQRFGFSSFFSFSLYRWEALPLWLGWLWVEVRPLRWTDQALPKTHRAPPLPVPEVRPGLFQVGPPRLTHEEALLNPRQWIWPTLPEENSVFFFLTFHTVFPRGEEPSWQALQSWSSS
jgi:hypothetical protein